MEKIASRLTTAGAEAFVHGAHCMSVSGACYLSAMLGGRSGNRGLCAQPCRLDWRCGKGRPCSLAQGHVPAAPCAGDGGRRDHNVQDRRAHEAPGIRCRGCDRLPRGACARALRRGHAPRRVLPQRLYGRVSHGKRDKTMFGYRTKDDVQSADKVLKSLAALYEKETPRVGVSMAFSLTETESALTVSDGENACTVTGDAPEKAINRALDAASAEKNLVKTGGTPFAVADFTADIAPGYMLPASALNALRRGALSELLDARGAARPWLRSDAPAPAAPEKRDRSRTGALWARFAELSQIPAGESFDKILPARGTHYAGDPSGIRRTAHRRPSGDPLARGRGSTRSASRGAERGRAARGVRRQHLRHSAHTPPGTHAARRRGAQHSQHRGAAPLRGRGAFECYGVV